MRTQVRHQHRHAHGSGVDGDLTVSRDEFHQQHRTLDDRLDDRHSALNARWHHADVPIVAGSLQVAVASPMVPVAGLSGLRPALEADGHVSRKEEQCDIVAQLVEHRGSEYRSVLAVAAVVVEGLVGESGVLVEPGRQIVRRVRKILYEGNDEVRDFGVAQPGRRTVIGKLPGDFLNERLAVKIGSEQVVVARALALPEQFVGIGMQIERQVEASPSILPDEVAGESAPVAVAARNRGAS